MTSRSSRNRRRAFSLGAAGALLMWLLLWVLPGGGGIAGRIDRMAFDELIRWSGGPPERDDFVLLGIDDGSLNLLEADEGDLAESEALQRMQERFPWDRRVWADVIDRLAEAGARLIVIDLVFSSPSDPEADQAFVDAVARHADKVVLTSMFAPVGTTEGEREMHALVEPLPELLSTGARVGFVNFPTDPRDGICRKARFLSSLGIENGEPLEGEPVAHSLAGSIVLAKGGQLLDGDQELRWASRSQTGGTSIYEPRSLHTIFVESLWDQNFGSGEALEGKVVMVGPTAALFQDIHPTPVGPLTGPQLHLQAASCALADSFLTPVAWGGWLVLGAGLVSAWFASRIGNAVVAAFWLVGLVLGLVFLVAGGLLWKWLLIPGVAAAVAAVVASFLAGQSYRLVVERLERLRLRGEFRRFVSRDVADRLADDPTEWARLSQGTRRRVVVLFSDVRGFTSRSEREGAEELVAQLNEYLTAMVAVVFRHWGTLDKFIGDAVMAHWGALGEGSDQRHARAALATAREMLEELGELNRKWRGEGREALRVGIGLHLGEVIAGELGSKDRIEFGVIGDAVNLASRIEGLTKPFGADLVYSSEVRDAAGESAGVPLGLVKVSGRSAAAELFAEGDGEAIAAAASNLRRGEDGVAVMDSK